MNPSLSALLTNHITLSPGSPLHNLAPGDKPWKSPDRLEELNALCPLSTLQPLSLEYQVYYYPHILSWLHHWTSLTGLALQISCSSADILTHLNQSLTCLTQLRFLIVKVDSQPEKLDLAGLNQLESLEVNTDHLDLNCLTTLNVKQLKVDFFETSRCQPFPHLTSLIALEVLSNSNTDMSELIGTLHHLPELRKLRLVHINLKPDWMCHLADVMPPKLKELTLKGLPSDMYSDRDTLDAILFSLPVDLHKFETDLPIWEAPKFVKWIDSWSGAFRKSPLRRYKPKDDECLSLMKAYAKCTHMTSLTLNLIGSSNIPLDSIEYSFANATHFRELDLQFGNPDQLMMTTLSAVAKNAVHLNKLTIGLSTRGLVISGFPDDFFQLQFPELQEFKVQGDVFHYNQWPLLRDFLEGHDHLKSVNVVLFAREAPKEAAQLMWTLFPRTLERVTVQILCAHDVDGILDGIPFLEALPEFLSQSCWHTLIFLLYSSSSSQMTLSPTALWIQNLTVIQMSGGKSKLLDLPDPVKARLADNRKRHQSLESLATLEEPDWCQPDWEDLM